MTNSLFVYGTLLFPDLVTALTGECPDSEPATLQNHQRCGITLPTGPATYPAIKQHPNHQVRGKLLKNLSQNALQCIEYYENTPPEYENAQVQVTLENGQQITTRTYRALPKIIPNLQGSWDPKTFEKYHLQNYTTIHIPRMLQEWTDRP